MKQKIIIGKQSYRRIPKILKNLHIKKFLLVCGKSFFSLSIADMFQHIDIPYTVFSEFHSNPLYEDVCKGVAKYQADGCSAIVAVGGGSAIDVAKCIKLFSKMNGDINYLKQPYMNTNIPLIALPTTAGTGSESTHFAVLYYEGVKQSVQHESILPDYAILTFTPLKTLPAYQKKCTMLDALCQAVESCWSVHSTRKTRKYALRAIKKIVKNKEAYLAEKGNAMKEIMRASNYAGRAINITKTTAAHAMSYKLTSMYNLPHGHAVALCLPKLWCHMENHLDDCIDLRGKEYLQHIFKKIAKSFGCRTVEEVIVKFEQILKEWDMGAPKVQDEYILRELVETINVARLRNNPVRLMSDDIYQIYSSILRG